jgi:hypothetical protein
MLLTAVSWVVLVASADAGRVEVEGLIITAITKPPPSIIYQPGRGGEFEVELTVTSKTGAELPIYQFEGPIRAVDADGKALSKPSRFRSGIYQSGRSLNQWMVSLDFEKPPPKTLAAVEGAISLAPSQSRTVTFEGAALKKNSSVAIEGGSVKLIALDLDDRRPDVWFRVTSPAASSQGYAIQGAKLTMVDDQGKETVLTSKGRRSTSDGITIDHRLCFSPERSTAGRALRQLRLETPVPKGPAKKATFRIPNVPVEDSRAIGRPGR